MTKSVTQILTRVATHVNGEAIAPTAGTDEWNLWQEFLNESVDDWYDAFDFSVNRKTFLGSIAASGTSLAITDQSFDGRLAGYVYINSNLYEEVLPQDAYLYSNSQYVTVGGNGVDGYYLNVYPAVASGASVVMPFWSRHSSLASPLDQVRVPTPNYLSYQTASKIFLQREDGRYAAFEDKAFDVLKEGVRKEVVKGNQYDSRVKNEVDKTGFVLGED